MHGPETLSSNSTCSPLHSTHTNTHVRTHAQTMAISWIPEKFKAVSARPLPPKTPRLSVTLSFSWTSEHSFFTSAQMCRCVGAHYRCIRSVSWKQTTCLFTCIRSFLSRWNKMQFPRLLSKVARARLGGQRKLQGKWWRWWWWWRGRGAVSSHHHPAEWV